MTQTIIALLIVAAAVAFTVCRVVRLGKGKSGCGCGCKDCPMKGRTDCTCNTSVNLPDIDPDRL